MLSREVLQRNWGHLLAVAANIVTFALLFRPWLTVDGVDGKARANAFGRIQATTSYMGAWSKPSPFTASISGTWAVLASAAIVVLVTAVALDLRLRSRALSRVATVSALAAAVFVLLVMWHLDSRAPQLYEMTARTWDVGGQIGSWIQWATNDGDLVLPGARFSAPYSTTTFTPAALTATTTSLAAAVVTAAQCWISRRGEIAAAASDSRG
ncbi:hypothetical protein [Nocardia blacklockiae]|uniref:hypothetical protein n=1 Tax=Nocardia blacklockiae TaxID=480036 RepID=UPI001893BB50|nr:hypothetical protein [Nocardia blacklockiae]MBF6169885.1 hypothetical protein [Nocardia blacklockiae]